MASLWADIDAALVALVVATTGRPALVAEGFDPDNVELPVTLIRGYDANYSAAEIPMMGHDYGLDGVRYPYELVYVLSAATAAAAKIAAASMARTLRNMLLSNPQLGLQAAVDDEYVHHAELTAVELTVRGRAGQNQAGKYMGAVALTFDVVTVVTVATS